MFFLLLAGSDPAARAADTPTRSARLSYLQGNVTVDQMDNTGSDPAQLNMPLAQGVRVTTGDDGQAEIEFEDGSLIRLTPNSSLGLTALTADGSGNLQTSLTLGYGLAYAELRAAAKFTYSVVAGGAVVSPVTNATVRIEMDKPPAAISVLDGTVQVERSSWAGGEGYRTNVNSGETLTGNAADAGRYSLTKGIAENSWDAWNDDRDKAASDEAANQTSVRDNYAGEAGYGWSDLDANGSWYNVPGEGEVWQPNVALDPSFDPYGYGSWVSYPGTGYVWASGYGWGWTPYRCGNWSYWDGFGWGWLPGSSCGFGGWGFGRGGG
ncbi:MAG: FecR family protein, partial [Edaphobacter sp.]